MDDFDLDQESPQKGISRAIDSLSPENFRTYTSQPQKPTSVLLPIFPQSLTGLHNSTDSSHLYDESDDSRSASMSSLSASPSMLSSSIKESAVLKDSMADALLKSKIVEESADDIKRFEGHEDSNAEESGDVTPLGNDAVGKNKNSGKEKKKSKTSSTDHSYLKALFSDSRVAASNDTNAEIKDADASSNPPSSAPVSPIVIEASDTQEKSTDIASIPGKTIELPQDKTTESAAAGPVDSAPSAGVTDETAGVTADVTTDVDEMATALGFFDLGLDEFGFDYVGEDTAEPQTPDTSTAFAPHQSSSRVQSGSTLDAPDVQNLNTSTLNSSRRIPQQKSLDSDDDVLDSDSDTLPSVSTPLPSVKPPLLSVKSPLHSEKPPLRSVMSVDSDSSGDIPSVSTIILSPSKPPPPSTQKQAPTDRLNAQPTASALVNSNIASVPVKQDIAAKTTAAADVVTPPVPAFAGNNDESPRAHDITDDIMPSSDLSSDDNAD